ncbi:MAG: hypothetical protein HY222_04160 [Thaumarchaeota archaeon]|nr:hypothetical protein [Nitrososphaerota archaeon]MBI3641570.1 hypothetical protein [Nitrososphaerota archaeon]
MSSTKSYSNNYSILFIALVSYGLIIITNNSLANADNGAVTTNLQETTGTFKITHEGTVTLMKPTGDLETEHEISLNISGNYTFSDSDGLKIDPAMLSGDLTIDDGEPIELNIQIGASKNFKTIIYKAMFINGDGSISGKLKLSSTLNFGELYSDDILSSSTITAKIDAAKYYTQSSVGHISIQPLSVNSSGCDPSIWDHVYHSTRLMVLNPCIVVTGVIEDINKSPADGDYHILLKLDPAYVELKNSVNDAKEKGDLVLEPICQHKPTKPKDAILACLGFSKPIDVQPVGIHVKVTGTHVRDGKHGGYNEIHPVYKMERLGN